ncbi:hypothetical protein KIPB_011767, partial [Kipferlia bialata]
SRLPPGAASTLSNQLGASAVSLCMTDSPSGVMKPSAAAYLLGNNNLARNSTQYLDAGDFAALPLLPIKDRQGMGQGIGTDSEAVLDVPSDDAAVSANSLLAYSAAVVTAPTILMRHTFGDLKTAFLRRTFTQHLNIDWDSWRHTLRPYTLILCMCLWLWLRPVLHGVGIYVYFGLLSLPYRALTVTALPLPAFLLSFQLSVVSTAKVAGIAVAGTFMVQCIALLCVSFVALAFSLFVGVPRIMYTLILSLTVVAALDAPIQLVSEHLLPMYAENGATDMLHLVDKFSATSGSEGLGWAVLVALMGVAMIPGLALLYHYLLRIHRNGRLADVFRRIHDPEMCFFAPNDYEVSLEELSRVLAEAKDWAGDDGATREVLSERVVVTDPAHSGYQETLTHICVEEVELLTAARAEPQPAAKQRHPFRPVTLAPPGQPSSLSDSAAESGLPTRREAHRELIRHFLHVQSCGTVYEVYPGALPSILHHAGIRLIHGTFESDPTLLQTGVSMEDLFGHR